MIRPPDQNRAILLTPPAPAAIAVVRIVGPDAAAFLAAHFSKEARIRRAVHGEVSDGSRVIDDPVVVLLPDSMGADINLHGGTWVVQSLLDLAARNGFQIIAPDSDQAIDLFDGDSLIDKEVAAAMPLARTTLALQVLLAQPTAWQKFAARSPSADEIRSVLADESLLHLLHPPRVAIVGPPNVGKSTLANQLFGQERSITADVAGTTRDWVGEIANIDGLAVMLVDTPGLRKTEDAIEQAAIARSAREIDAASVVILVLDATRPLEGEQSQLEGSFTTDSTQNAGSEVLRRAGFLPLKTRLFGVPQNRRQEEGMIAKRVPGAGWGDVIVVVNKSDGLPAWEISQFDSIHTIATTGAGIDLLRTEMKRRFGVDRIESFESPRCWTTRQRELLERATVEPGSKWEP